jgi:hypothetical protein
MSAALMSSSGSALNMSVMRTKTQAEALVAFGQTLPPEQPLEMELKIRMPSRENYLYQKHEQLVKVKSLRYALDEMVDHIEEAMAGEFG